MMWARVKSWSGATAALFVVLTGMVAGPAFAVNPDEILPDQKLEQRARALSAELRCVVCQNQSIDDSDAPLAKDLRRLVRERLLAGDSDAQIKQYVVDKYGTFVLLKPPFNYKTWGLWLLPFVIVGLAFWAVYRGLFYAGSKAGSETSTVAKLTDDEQRRVDEALARADDRNGGD